MTTTTTTTTTTNTSTTTTIRLPDDVKARVLTAAEATGLSPHGFMVQAIEAQAREVEEQAAFERLARERLAEYRRTGVAVPFDEAREYLQARAQGLEVKRPQARRVSPPAARKR